jgi:hypothetical protein
LGDARLAAQVGIERFVAEVLADNRPMLKVFEEAGFEVSRTLEGSEVEVVETDRGGKSTYHAPGQLVCYPILDLTRHGQDVKKYCRDLELALIAALAPPRGRLPSTAAARPASRAANRPATGCFGCSTPLTAPSTSCMVSRSAPYR